MKKFRPKIRIKPETITARCPWCSGLLKIEPDEIYQGRWIKWRKKYAKNTQTKNN